jgi:GNAT superfamily N-acetyltransferase
MCSHWKPRKCQDGDEKDILDLFNRGFPDERNIEQWTWQYRSNPAGKGMVFLADSDGRVVGHYAIIPTLFKVGLTEVLGSQSVDTITHADFQKKGIFTTLARLAYKEARSQGVRLVYGYPNRFSHQGLVKRLEFREIARIPKYAMPTTLKGHLLGVTTKPEVMRRLSFLSRLGASRARGKRLPKAEETSIIERAPRFGGEYDELWNAAADNLKVAVVRNADYLNWRYTERPESEYNLFEARGDKSILGFVVGRTLNRDSWKEGYIVDSLCLSTTVFEVLLDALIGRFKEVGVDIIYTWMLIAPDYRGALLNKGFKQVPSEFLLTTKALGEDLEASLYIKENWYVTRGDCDGI